MFTEKSITFKRILLAIASGLLIFLSFPKWNLGILAWVALVPIFCATDGTNFKSSFFLGWLTGFIAFCGTLYWIVPTLQAAEISKLLGVFALFLLAGILGIYYALFTGILAKFPNTLPEPIDLILCTTLFVSLEYLRGHLFTGFPWALLGYSQWKFPPIIQISKWTGVYGLSALLVIWNRFIFRSYQTKKVKISSGLLCLIPLLVTAFLWANQKNFEENRKRELKVSLLQGNVDQYKKWSPEFVKEILDRYDDLCAMESQAQGSDNLIVWPESALPGWFPQELWLKEWVETTVKKTERYHLIGAVTQSSKENYNSAFLLDPDGKIVDRYDKMHLVPFGEFVPLQSLLGQIVPVLNQLGGFSPGKKGEVLEIAQAKLGVGICYESIFPELIREQVSSGAEVLVNITNDGWYLDTAGPEQHFSMNIFRAVENGRFLVRSANTGISGVIRPSGVISKISKLNERTVLNDFVMPIQKKTFYTKYGDIFAWLCCATTLLGIFLSIFSQKIPI